MDYYSKANEVFNTYELLENIMSHFSMIELYALPSLNQTFRRISLTSRKIKLVMEFEQHHESIAIPEGTQYQALTAPCLGEMCRNHGIPLKVLKSNQSGPEVCINHVVLHLCDRLKVQILVVFEGPIFCLMKNCYGDPEVGLLDRHCKLRLWVRRDDARDRVSKIRGLLEGSCRPFLMQSWVTSIPMGVDVTVLEIGRTRAEPFEQAVEKSEGTVGRLLLALCEFLDLIHVGEEKA